ncbi:MAG: bifunctional biotin--[acetyl-CoA-carboxylase] ligase/biotin operon repressor BirA [Candidatus Thiodiazotropha sp. (ex Dulcina madagascariensis)]|nr:bifunctional biotin--[acetyl-CoA-carboxylase] ligase/biotin operon repressor BirA [Candidatus Thiodiazotropha sp. (ex Dulcina madagascariensis)]
MPLSHELIERLADGRFHSGRELGQLLDISRTAVWKKLNHCKQRYGLEIDAVKGRGYRLREPLDLLNQESILQALAEGGLEPLPALYLHPSIDSTNSWLLQQAAAGAESGAVCLAEQQLAGKGRHGREWVSPFGRNIYLSLLWRFELPPMQIAGLSLASAIGVLRLLHQLNVTEAGLKWPNDILWREKKLAGLLLEIAGEAGGPSQVVIGVGLNTRLGDQGEQIDQPWVDLDTIPHVMSHTRNQLASAIILRLREVIERYRLEGLAPFIDEWRQYDLLLGKEVVIRSPGQAHKGEHLGIDPSGGIRIRIDGREQCFHAGEVSLRWGAGEA